MKFETYKLPAFWAPYFVNGDASHMEEGEQSAADDWLAENGLGFCVDVSGEPEFCTYHDARAFVPFACDCLEFTFESAQQ